MLRAADFCRRVVTLIAFAFASSAYAQGANFSTLAWGDTVGTVHDKLKADSYDGLDYKCKFEVLFTGGGSCPFGGMRRPAVASFVERRLVEVDFTLHTSADANEALNTLSRKHGEPRVSSEWVGSDTSLIANVRRERKTYYWQARNGDSIILVDDTGDVFAPLASLTYTSAALNAKRSRAQAAPKY